MSLTGKSALTTSQALVNDGFWLDVAVGDLLGKYRIPAEYADDTINWGLALAVVRTNNKLVRAKEAIILLGYSTFQLYLTNNSDSVAGSELLQIHYEHAVFSRAKAFLLQQFKTINRREVAEDEAKESEETEQFWMDESAKSVAAIMTEFLPGEIHVANANAYVASL